MSVKPLFFVFSGSFYLLPTSGNLYKIWVWVLHVFVHLIVSVCVSWMCFCCLCQHIIKLSNYSVYYCFWACCSFFLFVHFNFFFVFEKNYLIFHLYSHYSYSYFSMTSLCIRIKIVIWQLFAAFVHKVNSANKINCI